MTLYYFATFILGMMFGACIVLGLAALFHQCEPEPMPATDDTEFL